MHLFLKRVGAPLRSCFRAHASRRALHSAAVNWPIQGVGSTSWGKSNFAEILPLETQTLTEGEAARSQPDVWNELTHPSETTDCLPPVGNTDIDVGELESARVEINESSETLPATDLDEGNINGHIYFGTEPLGWTKARERGKGSMGEGALSNTTILHLSQSIAPESVVAEFVDTDEGAATAEHLQDAEVEEIKEYVGAADREEEEEEIVAQAEESTTVEEGEREAEVVAADFKGETDIVAKEMEEDEEHGQAEAEEEEESEVHEEFEGYKREDTAKTERENAPEVSRKRGRPRKPKPKTTQLQETERKQGKRTRSIPLRVPWEHYWTGEQRDLNEALASLEHLPLSHTRHKVPQPFYGGATLRDGAKHLGCVRARGGKWYHENFPAAGDKVVESAEVQAALWFASRPEGYNPTTALQAAQQLAASQDLSPPQGLLPAPCRWECRYYQQCGSCSRPLSNGKHVCCDSPVASGRWEVQQKWIHNHDPASRLLETRLLEDLKNRPKMPKLKKKVNYYTRFKQYYRLLDLERTLLRQVHTSVKIELEKRGGPPAFSSSQIRHFGYYKTGMPRKKPAEETHAKSGPFSFATLLQLFTRRWNHVVVYDMRVDTRHPNDYAVVVNAPSIYGMRYLALAIETLVQAGGCHLDSKVFEYKEDAVTDDYIILDMGTVMLHFTLPEARSKHDQEYAHAPVIPEADWPALGLCDCETVTRIERKSLSSGPSYWPVSIDFLASHSYHVPSMKEIQGRGPWQRKKKGMERTQ